MASIWLVTAGEYSDYRVVAAFSSEEGADQYVAHRKEYQERVKKQGGVIWGPGEEVEEFDLDPQDRSVLDDGRIWWGVWFLPTGDVRKCEALDSSYFDKDEYADYMQVEAKTKEQAIKIAAERRAQVVAHQEGIA